MIKGVLFAIIIVNLGLAVNLWQFLAAFYSTDLIHIYITIKSDSNC